MTTLPTATQSKELGRRAEVRDRLDLLLRFCFLSQIVFGLYLSGFVWLAATKRIDESRRELLSEPGAILFLAILWSFCLGAAVMFAVVSVRSGTSAVRRFAFGLLPWTVLVVETTVAIVLLV